MKTLATERPAAGSWTTAITIEQSGTTLDSMRRKTICLAARGLMTPEMGLAPSVNELGCHRKTLEKTGKGLRWRTQ